MSQLCLDHVRGQLDRLPGVDGDKVYWAFSEESRFYGRSALELAGYRRVVNPVRSDGLWLLSRHRDVMFFAPSSWTREERRAAVEARLQGERAN